MTDTRPVYTLHNTDDIETPDDLKQVIKSIFKTDDFDPSPLHGFTDGRDGLKIDWAQRTFVNPPFSQKVLWLQKAIAEKQKGKLVVMLLPANPCRHFWFQYVWPHATSIMFIKGAVKFKGFKTGSPFGVALIVFDGTKKVLAKKAVISSENYDFIVV